MDTKVVLVYGDNLYQYVIPTGGQITFGSGKKDTVKIETIDPKGMIITNKTRSGISIKGLGINQRNVPTEGVVMIDESIPIYIYCTTLVRVSAKKYKMPYRGSVKLGRDPDKNDIVIDLPFVSNEHLVFKCDSGKIRVEDLQSTNGTYIRGKRTEIGTFNPGDELCILSVCIRFINGMLTFEGVNDDLKLIEADNSGIQSVKDSLNPDKLVFHQSPRVQESLPSEEIIIANPPTKGQKYEKSRGAGSMLLGSGAMIGASMMTGMMSPALLAARSASLISPMTSAVNTGKVNKKRKISLEKYTKDRKEKYSAYIEDQKALIESVAAVQRNIISIENPSPEESIRTVLDLKRNLWERMTGDRDFLDVRLGMGYEDLCVPVKSRNSTGGFKMEDDEAERLVEQIIEETKIVDNIPTRIPLSRTNTLGFIGNRRTCIELVRNMLICLCSSHSYEDVKIVGIFDESEEDYWEYLKWIPHFRDEGKEYCMISFDKDGADALCDYVSEIISLRKENKENNKTRDITVPSPFYIFIIGSKELVENNSIMNDLFDNDPALGLSTLFLYDDLYRLPPKCRYIVDVKDTECASYYDRSESNEKTFFTIDKPVKDLDFDKYVRTMSAIKYEGFSSKSGLPKSISFLEGYQVNTVEQLEVLKRWANAVPDKSLAAPIGKLAGDQTLMFDIHEKAHGPHGLVAGTTGSGKSELLQTWILSMACNFHPHQVAFVLIDYKGGGMANLLEPLPHVVGKITNIGSNIQRSLLSLQSEISRRQVVFDKYQKIFPTVKLNHIDAYQKLFREGKVEEPLPHLIIVADEFAELKKEEPDFMAGLVKAARVGRSLGIHLVLATQKPGGIVDEQIQSNSRFRLCLKVQDTTDSREMIERGDAAYIRERGRGFIRVGKDEYFDTFQSYWSGAPYFGDTPKVVDENPVRYVDKCGRKINFFEPTNKKSSGVDELTAVVNYIVSEARGIKPANGPWLPELPDKLDLDELDSKAKYSWLKIPVGKYDIPSKQEQGVQIIDFVENGHYAVYGAPGTGKTTFLKTLVTSICRNFTPEDITMYILDFGGWGMSVFANMPHVGGIVLDSEEEKLSKLEQMIRDEFTRRKMLFLKSNVNTLAAYRESVDNKEPAIIIIIDNIVPIFDMYPDIENFLIKIANEGTSYGIYLVYTANSTTGVRYKLIQNMKGAVAFELTDKGDFANIVGRLNGMTLPAVQGRAFAKGNPPVEFQTAFYASGDNDKMRNENLKNMIEKLNKEWRGNRPLPIPVMPDQVTSDMMMESYREKTSIPVGISRADIKTVHVDLSERYVFLVTGDSVNDGISRTVSGLVNMVTSKFEDTLLYVFDSERQGLEGLRSLSSFYSINNDSDSVTSSLNDIVSKLNDRKNKQKAAKNSNDGTFSERVFIEDYPLILIAVDEIGSFQETVSNADVDSMERICRWAKDLGVIVFVGGITDNVMKYSSISSMVSAIVNNQNALQITGTPNQLSCYTNKLKYNEKDVPLESGSGYLYINGDCKAVKYIDGGGTL